MLKFGESSFVIKPNTFLYLGVCVCVSVFQIFELLTQSYAVKYGLNQLL